MALSWPLLGVAYPAYVWASLLPIVAGCSLSAMKEISFNIAGFNNAMISNLGMVLRNIYSKKVRTAWEAERGEGGSAGLLLRFVGPQGPGALVRWKFSLPGVVESVVVLNRRGFSSACIELARSKAS